MTPLAISSARCCFGTTPQHPMGVARTAHLRCAHDAIARYPGRPSTRGLDRLLLVWETSVAKGDEALHGVGVFGEDCGHRVDMLLQVGPGFRLRHSVLFERRFRHRSKFVEPALVILRLRSSLGGFWTILQRVGVDDEGRSTLEHVIRLGGARLDGGGG